MSKIILVLILGISCIGWSWPAGWDSGLIDGGQYGTILPASDNTYDIGSTSRAWKDFYIDGTIYVDGNMPISGGTGIGIGTSNPQTTLEVVGTAKATNFAINTTSPTAKISVMNSGSETLLALGNTTPGDTVIVTAAGNVGIGTTAPQGKLEVDGSIYIPEANLTAGYALCKTVTGFIGHCTDTPTAAGACTCVTP